MSTTVIHVNIAGQTRLRQRRTYITTNDDSCINHYKEDCLSKSPGHNDASYGYKLASEQIERKYDISNGQ